MYEFLPCVKDQQELTAVEFSIDSQWLFAYSPSLKKPLQLCSKRRK